MMGSYVLIYGLSSDLLEYHGKKYHLSSIHKNGLYLVLLSH